MDDKKQVDIEATKREAAKKATVKKATDGKEAGAENGYTEQVLPQNQDSVFSKLYSKKDRVIDLYHTLHSEDTREISEEDVEIITLENIVLARRYNDVAFQIGDRLMILVEHQSTINENMPLRMLLYVADEYEKLIHKSEIDLYKSKLVKLPKPEFYIVYVGDTEWKARELKFSDAYGREDGVSLELTVKVLKEAYAREFEGSELFKEFLGEISNEEGMKMVHMEYDYEIEKSVIREEAREEGIEKGIAALVETCKRLHVSFLDVVESLVREFELSEQEARSKAEKYWN